MKYEAVIFDLFGTLVDIYSRREYESALTKMASVLSTPPDEFSRLWYDTSKRRGIGIFQSIKANIEYICQELEVHVLNAQVREAAKVRFNFVTRSMAPRGDAVEVLSCLRSAGYKIGLISNCSPQTPVIWKKTPLAPLFDVTIFSCSAGLQKPDPRIYKIAIKQLATKAENCLFVGDGDSQELSSAASIGMHPVLIRATYEDSTDALRENAEAEDWDGPVISSLTEVLDLVK